MIIIVSLQYFNLIDSKFEISKFFISYFEFLLLIFIMHCCILSIINVFKCIWHIENISIFQIFIIIFIWFNFLILLWHFFFIKSSKKVIIIHLLNFIMQRKKLFILFINFQQINIFSSNFNKINTVFLQSAKSLCLFSLFSIIYYPIIENRLLLTKSLDIN